MRGVGSAGLRSARRAAVGINCVPLATASRLASVTSGEPRQALRTTSDGSSGRGRRSSFARLAEAAAASRETPAFRPYRSSASSQLAPRSRRGAAAGVAPRSPPATPRQFSPASGLVVLPGSSVRFALRAGAVARGSSTWQSARRDLHGSPRRFRTCQRASRAWSCG
jgi:hypothetical protein